MDVDGLGVLDGAVGAVLLQQCGVVEEARRDGLPDDVMVAHVGGELNLHSLHQAQQLLPDVPRPLHAPHLHVHRDMQAIWVLFGTKEGLLPDPLSGKAHQEPHPGRKPLPLAYRAK